jgi:hypothetical protein
MLKIVDQEEQENGCVAVDGVASKGDDTATREPTRTHFYVRKARSA